jgi:hypothetical protein
MIIIRDTLSREAHCEIIMSGILISWGVIKKRILVNGKMVQGIINRNYKAYFPVI